MPQMTQSQPVMQQPQYMMHQQQPQMMHQQMGYNQPSANNFEEQQKVLFLIFRILFHKLWL